MFDFINRAIVEVQTRKDAVLGRQQGQAAVEYALVIGLISLTVVAGSAAMGGSLSGLFGDIAGALNGVTVATPSGA